MQSCSMEKSSKLVYNYCPVLLFLLCFAVFCSPISGTGRGWIVFFVVPVISTCWIVYFGRAKYQVRNTWYYLLVVWASCTLWIASGHTVVFKLINLSDIKQQQVRQYIVYIPQILALAIIIYKLCINRKYSK